MRPGDAGERARLHATFTALCAIPSPYGSELACATWVRERLEGLGFVVDEDDVAEAAGAQCGNLLCRLPAALGEARPGLLLCAHLDTVALGGPVEPVEVDGGWENAHDAILGADNKAAVAVLLALAERWAQHDTPRPLEVELLFTVCEENALRGSTHLDRSRLSSRFGYVFDHATPIGEIVLASPTYFRLQATFAGASAHAGIRPEDGRSAVLAAARAVSAMALGRLDAETTTNVGRVEGGSASTNVVPDSCLVEAEARSLDPERVEDVVAELVDACQDGANATGCDVDTLVERRFRGYRTRPDAEPVAVAEVALRACGYEPRHIVTGGGSDANALQAAGLPCVNLANGTLRNHEPTERVGFSELEGMLDVTLALVGAAAARADAAVGS